MESVMIEVAKKYSDKIYVGYIDLDSANTTMNEDLARKLKVMGFPTLMLIGTDGKVFYKEVDVKSLEEIEEIFKNYDSSLVK
ncbi:thioredoxin family protein [Clostridium collagenovorans]|nr:thioredoxin family protein [Clostridium collagenovorans]